MKKYLMLALPVLMTLGACGAEPEPAPVATENVQYVPADEAPPCSGGREPECHEQVK